MTTPTEWMKNEYNDLVSKGFDWKPPVITGESSARCIIDGSEKIMLCANNYLISRNLFSFKDNYLVSPLKMIGKSSLEIYTIHWVVLYVIYCIIYSKWLRGNQSL